MAIRLQCGCGRQLSADERLAGKKVRCPGCNGILVVPVATDAVTARKPAPRAPSSERLTAKRPRARTHEDDEESPRDEGYEQEGYDEDGYEEEEERPRKKKKGMGRRKRLRLVRLGLGFHYAMFLILLITFVSSILVGLLGPLVAAASQSAGALLAIMGLLGLLMIVALFGTPILGATGSILCFWAPAKSGARIYIILSFSMFAASLLAMFVSFVASVSAPVAGLGSQQLTLSAAIVYQLLSILLMVSGAVLFMLFLRQLAYYLRDRATGDEALSLLITWLAAGIGGPVLLVVLGIILQAMGCVGLIIMLLVLVGWIVFWVMVLLRMLNLIATLRALCDRYS